MGSLLLTGALFVGGAVALTLLGLLVVRRRLPHHLLSPHNDVAGFLYATLAVIYAVVLAFVVISVWEDFERARDTADAEANAVADLYHLAAWLPDGNRDAIRQTLAEYARVVAEEEWPAMADGAAPLPAAEALMDQLWAQLQAAAPATPEAAAAYGQALDVLDDLADERRVRLLESEEGVPGVLWFVLVAGGVLTVAYGFGFGVENARSHAVFLATLAASIALLLFLVFALNHAFRGGVRIEPDGFELVLARFGG